MHAVQVMADEPDTHTEAVVERFAEISYAIIVRVAQQPEIRNVRIPDVPLARENAGADAIKRGVEPFGKHGRMIRLAVAVAVFEQADALAVFGIFSETITQMALHLSQPVVHTA